MWFCQQTKPKWNIHRPVNMKQRNNLLSSFHLNSHLRHPQSRELVFWVESIARCMCCLFWSKTFPEIIRKAQVRSRQLMDLNHLLHSRHQLTNRRSLVTAIYNHLEGPLSKTVKVISWNPWSLRIFSYLSHLCSNNNNSNMKHWPHRQTRSTSCRRKHKI